jgi:hypothetical protein
LLAHYYKNVFQNFPVCETAKEAAGSVVSRPIKMSTILSLSKY